MLELLMQKNRAIMLYGVKDYLTIFVSEVD